MHQVVTSLTLWPSLPVLLTVVISFYLTFYVGITLYLSITLAFYSSRMSGPIKFKRAVFKSGNSFRVTLPMPIVQTMKIEEKDVLQIWMDDGHIVIGKLNAEG